jgi:pimeloyl-ACP methyl ester carboxylesterase
MLGIGHLRRRSLLLAGIIAFSTQLFFGLLSETTAAPPPAKRLSDVDLREGYVESEEGVRIHYVEAGSGPLMILVHGFADYWFSWRYQIPKWSEQYRVVAIDLRGYNLSSKPEGVWQYSVEKTVNDLNAVLAHFDARTAVVVGHDWGGFLAWEYAMRYPRRVDKLVVLNSPHPRAIMREVAENSDAESVERTRASLSSDEALLTWTPRRLASWVRDPLAREQYIEAFQRSSVEGMLNHYRANYSSTSGTAEFRRTQRTYEVKCPVLLIHGLKDDRVALKSLDGNWAWVKNELSVVTLPRAGHFVHHDAADFLSQRVLRWLGPNPATTSASNGATDIQRR